MALFVNGFFPGEIEPSVTVGGCIDIYENAWPDPQGTIERIENECRNPDSCVSWLRAGTIGMGAYQNARTNRLIMLTETADIDNSGLLQNIHNQFNMLLLATTLPYARKYGIQETLSHEGYQILRYEEGQKYSQHYDGGTSIGRAISAVCYLNSDYEGGEIEFPFHNVKIKPQAGMLILFPSNFAYSHIAHPITNGTKYNLVTWISDR